MTSIGGHENHYVYLDENPVLTWAERTLDAFQADPSTPPTDATQTMAMESIAVFDVLNAIHDKPAYMVDLDAPDGISDTASIAAAADHILSYTFPDQRATFDAELAKSLASVPDGESKTAGVAFGNAVAEAVTALHADDGWNTRENYIGSTEPGEWRPTEPDYLSGLDPQWGSVTPFALTSGSQFRPAGPPALTSPEYAAAVNEVKQLGSATSTERTDDQTEIAQFWANDHGTYTAPGQWDHIAIDIAKHQGTSVEGSALMLAELNVALADAAIAAWDTKYAYNEWRPITAIRLADTDGNPATTADPEWSPLLPTPNHPEYPSGHATFGGAAATVLTDYFGDIPFSATSADLPGVTRHFDNFAQAADESAQSRIYGGVHFQSSAQDGLALGDKVGDLVLNTFPHQDWLV